MAGYRRRTKSGVEYWELTWRENGKPKTESLGRASLLRESEVRGIAARKSRDLILAQHAAIRPQQSFATWCAEYLSWHEAEYPDSHWRVKYIVDQFLLAHFTGTLEGVSQLDVERYKAARMTPMVKRPGEPPVAPAPATVAKEMRTLSAILNRAHALGKISVNPCKLVRAPKSLNDPGIRFFTAEEMQLVYGGCVEEWHRYAWMLYAGTGARRMEGLNLKWRDVGGEALRLVSTGEERTKSGLSRDLPLSAGAGEALAFFKSWKEKSDLYVLPRLAPPSLSRAAIKCIGRAGLPGSLHTFRHTFISHLAMDARVPLLAIKEWAGHSTIRVTEKYMHLRPSVTDDILKGMRI